ncbi:zinc-binding alcohol dehydrogenase family protein [Curtobacterium sp. MCBD17_008]|uniref:zinc-binding alcohol dehydrogenase family protein n=1 Tax=Curtobacterium sp. MCBD17_008 TaxID=2175656 RepID=UPI000DA8C15C|nr:zinc-binding alcohol dehydrogenase family protein [Curtobacterium sp. MCBD17_008]PZE94780.1 Zn-dependent oxidoreductase [Curtobacterium sp. MCBD17_008]
MTADDPTTTNAALFLLSPRGPFEVRPTPVPTPAAGQVVVRVRAAAVNPVDAITGPLRRLVTPWVRFPTVLGSDVAGEVLAVGPYVTALAVGDRVTAFAAGQEKPRNSAAEGGFQRIVTVLERVTTRLPDDLSSEQAAVLPLALATAAAGLYEADQLALPLPGDGTDRSDQVVLVWGASTSVGSNAVQLARASGYTVVATAGRANHDLVRSLGADTVLDYRDDDVDAEVVAALRGRRLAGTIAIGSGSLGHALRITRRASGAKRIASAYPDPVTAVRSRIARLRGIRVSAIWGGTPVVSPVGPAVFRDFLPAALADGRFRAAPEAMVVGHGLEALPGALQTLRNGVSARKVVVGMHD